MFYELDQNIMNYDELDYQDRKNNFDIRDVKLFESNIVFSSSGKSIVS